MIKINIPGHIPNILRTKGKNKRRGNSNSYTRNRVKFDSGVKKFKFDSGIYGHKTVKQALIKAQHAKCCFCESKVTHIAYGDVEHFRPKAGVRQKSNGPLEKPGYYWLAYEWSNLLFSCQLCNQRHKENLFPLNGPIRRARSHRDDIAGEKPLFINPAEEDPQEYISYREEIAYSIDGNLRGEATIGALGLNRNELRERRREYFDILKTICKVAHSNPPIPESKEANDHVTKSIQNSSQYASMIRSAVKACREKLQRREGNK